MMKSLSRKILLFILLAGTCFNLSAQDVTGIWKGYFITESGEYYKLEFQVLQKGASGATGVSYSYLDVRFYGKATMTGNFIKSSSAFRIREIKTVEVKSTMGGGTCIMNYDLSYSKSGKEEFLEGTYLGKYENKYSAASSGKWGDCGGGKVFLRKVNTTDFYVEPFLKNKIRTKPVIINEAPPVKKDSIKKVPVTVPVTKPPVTVPDKKPVNKPPVTNNKPVTKTNNPVVVKKDTATTNKISNPGNKPVTKIVIPPPAVIKNRTNELVKIFTVSEENITVKLFDNGEIDGDTISVYLDNKLVLSSKRLTASPLEVKIKMDEDNSEHELTMVAENLGTIPPNTSLMVVEAGEQRFDVRITSTEQKNAVVRFRYQKRK
ncbi:MAG TPA: hypothetical protein VMZ03_12645 [Chitinophagaceae bacterium]|nr:hypothetical protein [Chitinophagaceae bacterium]